MLSKDDIRTRYDDFASRYDIMDLVFEVLGLRKLRKALLAKASGNVLEVAVGTGINIPRYPASCNITAVDLSQSMMEIARRKAARRAMAVEFHVMDAESLSFDDGSFDTVVETMATCTFPDPVMALREMARVCKNDGRILLLEHGRSRARWLARFQDWRAESHSRRLGCVWNREPRDLVGEAGLTVVSTKRSFFGVFHSIVAVP